MWGTLRLTAPVPHPELHVVEASSREGAMARLPNDAIAMVDAGGRLTWPDSANANGIRELYLEGGAQFEMTRVPVGHYVVITPSARVIVTGAAFRVTAVDPAMPCSLEFVQMLGRATHFDLWHGGSSFPVAGLVSLEALHDLAEQREWTRDQIAPGDVLLTGFAADDDAPTVAEALVVLEVGTAAREGSGALRRCMLATGRADPRPPREWVRVAESMQWCDTTHDDVAIRWCATPDEFEAAAHGTGAGQEIFREVVRGE